MTSDIFPTPSLSDQSLKKLRDVGLLERYSTERHHLGFYNNVIIGARYEYTTPLRTAPGGSPTGFQMSSFKARIYSALAGVISEHPMLSVTILNEEGQDGTMPYFAQLREVDLDDNVVRIEEQDLSDYREIDRLLEEEHGRDFKAEGREKRVCWRVRIVVDPEEVRGNSGSIRKFWCFFIYYHVIADGESGLCWHRSFSREINSAFSADTVEPELASKIVVNPEQSSQNPPPPNLEAMHPLPLSLSYIAKAVFKEYIYAFPPNNTWVGNPPLDCYFQPAPSQVPQTRVRTLLIPATVLTPLLQSTRREKTTLQALLQAVLSLCFLRVVGPRSGKEEFVTTGVISLRRFLSPTASQQMLPSQKEAMGVYVSSYSEKYSLSKLAADSLAHSSKGGIPWNHARASRKLILKELDKKGSDTPTGLLRYISDFEKYFTSKLGKRREESLEVSNIGVFRVGEVGREEEAKEEGKGGWKVRDMRFSQSAGVTSDAVTVGLVSVEGGGLAAGCVWQEGVVEETVVEGVLGAVDVLLRRAAGVAEQEEEGETPVRSYFD